MHKVITINLNGNAYQLDEPGYDALREYLGRAERQLEGNPDRAEIMADIEQAIADKFQRCLGPHKTVVSSGEVSDVIAEMGPVGDATEAKQPAGGRAAADEGSKNEPRATAAKRLYRVPAGAMVAGVCTGIASYFAIDVTLVRIAFVVAALLSRGLAIIAYIVMMFVIPEASSPEEAAGGAPLNAKEVIDRAKRRSAETTREWRRQWRRQQREWRRQWPGAAGFAPPLVMSPLLPLTSLMHMALFLLTAAALISLVNTGEILNWELPPDIPVWAGALILLFVYQMAVTPLRLASKWTWSPAAGPAAAPLAFWNAVVWMAGVAFAIWLASNHVPEIREFLHRLPDLARDFGFAMRDLFAR